MNLKPTQGIKIQERRIAAIKIDAKKPRNLQLSTAVNTQETKRRNVASSNPALHCVATKKQIPLFSHNQLADDHVNIPYARSMLAHLRTVESHFFTRKSYDEITMFSVCRLRFIMRLKIAKHAYGLLEETIFLAVHIYDKFFELEKDIYKQLSKFKMAREARDWSRYLGHNSKLNRLFGKSKI